MHKLLPFVGVPNVLKELSTAGITLGIVTSNSKENVLQWLNNHLINQYFNFIYSAPNYFGKNASLNEVIKLYNLNAKNICYVGDETRDIEAASQCNISSLAVTWGFNSEKILLEYNPDYIARVPEDILKMVQNWRQVTASSFIDCNINKLT